MDVCSESSITCHIVIENLSNSQEIVKSQKYLNGSLSLWRNEFRELVLTVCKSVKVQPLKFVLKYIKIHSKFMKDGKSSLILVNHNVRLLLSNCPPANLKKFFRVLSVKLTKLRTESGISTKKKMITGLSKVFEEISPINENDVNTINKLRREKDANFNHSTSNCITGTKRKQPFTERSNNQQDLVEPLNKKRILVLPCDNLSREQKHVLHIIKQGKNIFLTGSAGTGKSHLLHHIVGMLPPSHLVITASTGVAASHIGGMTLHSFAGIKASMPVNQAIQAVNKRKAIVKQWKSCKYLIIDEISMIDADFFDCIEAIARAVQGCTNPFGGIQLIICGDFFQLPPVSKSNEKKKFCFQAQSWSNCIEYTWELHKIYRQTDLKFIKILQDIRLGKCDANATAVLKSTYSNRSVQNGITATQLCTHAASVKQLNDYHLQQLDGSFKTFTAQDSSPDYSSMLDKVLPNTRCIELKVGAQVMLTKNLDVRNGLVNGARGIIIDFTKNSYSTLPKVRFLSGIERVISLENHSMKISTDITVFRKQIPIKLAWAISIHKSQGMSLDYVSMSLSHVFESGQAYVALSRAKSLKGLRVLDFDPSCVKSNVEVLRFYRHLRVMQNCEVETLDSSLL